MTLLQPARVGLQAPRPPGFRSIHGLVTFFLLIYVGSNLLLSLFFHICCRFRLSLFSRLVELRCFSFLKCRL
jgi:hypothetical protein